MRGNKEKTSGGLKATDLVKNKRGKNVSKKMSALSKKRFASTVGPWIEAVVLFPTRSFSCTVGPWMQAVKTARADLTNKGFELFHENVVVVVVV